MAITPLLSAIGIIIAFVFYSDTEASPKNHEVYGTIVSFFGIIAFIMDILTHSVILGAYIKGLFAMTRYYFNPAYKDRYGGIDSRQHEQMIEASRYTVLFGLYIVLMVCMSIILVGLHFTITYDLDFSEIISFYYDIAIASYLVTRDVITLFVIFLSFEFGHIWYEQNYLCGYCDKRMKQYFENKANEMDLNTYDYNNEFACCCCCKRDKNGIIKDVILINGRNDLDEPLLNETTDLNVEMTISPTTSANVD